MQAHYLILEGIGICELLCPVNVKPNEREQALSVSMLKLAVGKAGKSPKPPPVGCTWIGSETVRESLSGERPECFGKDVRVF